MPSCLSNDRGERINGFHFNQEMTNMSSLFDIEDFVTSLFLSFYTIFNSSTSCLHTPHTLIFLEQREIKRKDLETEIKLEQCSAMYFQLLTTLVINTYICFVYVLVHYLLYF